MPDNTRANAALFPQDRATRGALCLAGIYCFGKANPFI